MKEKRINLNLTNENNIINANKKYSVFLKRKRLEQKMTLEKMAKGICTPSYLSRIENNIVSVDDYYYVALFKKLNIDFYALKETKDQEIFTQLLKFYLLKEEDRIIEIISNALNTNHYIDLEFELMVLFDNILKKMYSEARMQIIELNEKVNVLVDEELVFYLFLTALYAYRTNQGVFAAKQVLMLCEVEMINDIFKYAITDLCLDIFFYTGSKEMFFKYYNQLNNESFFSVYAQTALKHQAQLAYLEYSLVTDKTSTLLLDYRLSFQNEEDINWIIIKNYYRFFDLIEIDEIFKNKINSASELALCEIICLKNDNFKHYFIKEYTNYKFTKYERHYEMLCLVCETIKIKKNNIEAFNILKEVIEMQLETTADDFFLQIELEIILELSSKIGKYKEATKIMSKYLKTIHSSPFIL